ncbi:hypothetical protein CTEN210_11874 [Chaetoceros tenuissimus]|uniref:Indole-3-glycerol-phosphate synthase n=1 Tax=Chaetoceros tenuissimus TaxID=426638 RepID=A0AAD3H9Y6_9STRA|nr:hypothetical protein CTEN210_11874 [Chaetoceros tenuissimus]
MKFISCHILAALSILSFSEAFAPSSRPLISSRNVLTSISEAAVVSKTALQMSTTTKGNNNSSIQTALQKMRGVSISVELNPSSSLTNMELEILSQELRKAKANAIFIKDVSVLKEVGKEQELAKGNFPGPVPCVFMGEKDDYNLAVENGASSIVVSVKDLDAAIVDIAVDVIVAVDTLDNVKAALDMGYDYSFLLSAIDEELVNSILDVVPKSCTVIASLDAMQKDSAEIVQAKELATLKSVETNAKVSGILMNDACVGDSEDLKYTSFIVEGVSKKSSSTFAMTGLTGAANGHFGSEISGGNAKAKWRRMEK